MSQHYIITSAEVELCPSTDKNTAWPEEAGSWKETRHESQNPDLDLLAKHRIQRRAPRRS